MSDGSKHRLLSASQALELEHLQQLIRSKDREAQQAVEVTRQLLEESRRQIDSLTERNRQLSSQNNFLCERVQSLEQAQQTEDATARKVIEIGSVRDSLVAELRDEVRGQRNQISSLLEEREILLEKLVLERSKTAMLTMQVDAQDKVAEVLGSTAHSASRPKSEAAVQTTDLGQLVLAVGDEDATSNDLRVSIETLKAHISTEESQRQYHEERAAVHSTNLALLHDRLQRQIQQQVQRLKAEQDSYQNMMSAFQSQRLGASLNATPAPNRKVPAADTLTASAVSSPFFQRQENEMLTLRKRLQELQARHDAPAPEARMPALHSTTMPAAQNSSILQRMLQSATTRH